MSYVRLSDLRGDDLDMMRSDPRTPDQMERDADRMEARARALREKTLTNDPAAPIYAAKASGLEVVARHLRQVAGTKRAFGMGATEDAQPAAPAVASEPKSTAVKPDTSKHELVLSIGVAPDPTKPNARIYNIGPCIPGDKPVTRAIYQVLSVASPAVGFYHGYKKNNGSILWGLWWSLMGRAFPVMTPAIAIADGLGKPNE